MIKINKEGKIEIFNVKPVYQNGEIAYFNTNITIKETGSIYNRLTYDGNAQRGFDDTTIDKKPLIDMKHVEKIKNSILDGGKVRGHLTWNIRATEELNDIDVDYYTYNSEKNCLTIEGNTITIPDSAHRHKALYEIYEQEKDDKDLMEYEFSLDIYNMSFEEEKEFFTDINSKGKPVCRNRTLFLSNDIRCQLIKELINESNLKNRVECEKERINNDKLTKFATLYDSLFGSNGVYKSHTLEGHNYKQLKNWLTKFYNELLNDREEFLYESKDEKTMIKENSMLLEEIAWWGYSYIAKKLEQDKSWKRSLNNKLNKKVNIQGMQPIDFWSKTNPNWDCIKTFTIDRESQKIIPTNSVYNSNTTRRKVQTIIALNLFS